MYFHYLSLTPVNHKTQGLVCMYLGINTTTYSTRQKNLFSPACVPCFLRLNKRIKGE